MLIELTRISNLELLMNWGPDNRHDATINVCDNPSIKFMPNLWGRDFDYPQLSALPNEVVPWGVMLENEPNWWGSDNGQDHGAGCNMTAQVAAERYYPNTGKETLTEVFRFRC